LQYSGSCSLDAYFISLLCCPFFFFQADDGIRGRNVTGVQTCVFRSTSSYSPICSDFLFHQSMALSLSVIQRFLPLTVTRGAADRSEERRVGKAGRRGWGGRREEKKSGPRREIAQSLTYSVLVEFAQV